MGRRPRVHFDGAIYHVFSRGVNRQSIFTDDQDRRAFLEGLKKICADAAAEILAYCLMGNHFHFAIKVGAVPLSVIMQRLETSYCLRFNYRHDRTGHLFQARYQSKICLTEPYLRTVIQYIVMNPVRAGLVSKPENWPWSSLGGKPMTEEIQHDLENFDPWANEPDQKLDLLRGEGLPARTLDDIAATIARQAGVDLVGLRSADQRRFVVRAKRIFARAALKDGHKGNEIARWLNMDAASVSRYCRSILQPARPDTKIADSGLADCGFIWNTTVRHGRISL